MKAFGGVDVPPLGLNFGTRWRWVVGVSAGASLPVKEPRLPIEYLTKFNKISKWFNANLLSLNYSKTYYMQFQSKNQISFAVNLLVTIN
jgi:hypothetical protein